VTLLKAFLPDLQTFLKSALAIATIQSNDSNRRQIRIEQFHPLPTHELTDTKALLQSRRQGKKPTRQCNVCKTTTTKA